MAEPLISSPVGVMAVLVAVVSFWFWLERQSRWMRVPPNRLALMDRATWTPAGKLNASFDEPQRDPHQDP